MTPEEYYKKWNGKWGGEGGWPDERCIDWAETFEPERIQFWLKYHKDYTRACRAVAENIPSFDNLWEETFAEVTNGGATR